VCVVRYQHIQNLRATAVDCWSIWTCALKRVLCVSASCRNTGCKMFTPLFYGTVSQLLINLVPFIVVIFTKKRRNYVIARRILNRFCQNQITASRHIHLRIFAESFTEFVQKLHENMWKNKCVTFFWSRCILWQYIKISVAADKVSKYYRYWLMLLIRLIL